MKPLSLNISLTQHRKENNKDYQVGVTENMSQGASFWNIQTDLEPIYNNFNILSYFSASLNIELLDAKEFEFKGKLINVYQFSLNNKKQRYYLLQLQKDDYTKIYQNPGKDKLAIRYSFTQKFVWPSPEQDQDDLKIENVQQTNIANVEFVVILKEEIQGQKFYEIDINIEDTDNWILNNIYPIHYDNRYKFGRISERRKSTTRRNYLPEELAQAGGLIQLPARLRLPEFTTDLEYFYLEPKSRRQKVIKNKHLALALQGGGCKGATYIGAYKAILDSYENQNIDITSVIGSSAGGIIGLAICCKLSPQNIVILCERYLSKVTEDKTYPQKTPQVQAMIDKYFKTIQQVLRNCNIVDEQIIQILKNFLNNKQFTDYIFTMLKEISGMAQNTNVLSLFQYENGERNLCGLLNGKLMTGQKVQQIAKSCILHLIQSDHFGKKVRKYYPNLKQQQYQQWATKLTMKELYKITGIEFTCTSVDTTNHMLRFLNHKTTPGLPVVNAVQMTGAFPVAFQATYWKKEWGKYYIHYKQMRREVDLEGSKFTDGGMLANFPIDCIDNDDMRPMYFSHVKDEQTIMFGVGLQQCPTTAEIEKKQVNNPMSWWSMIKTAGFTNLPSIIKQYLEGKFLGILGIFNSSQVRQIDITNYDILQQLSQIPLFDFIYNLLITYTSTKDKLAEQSFRHQSYQINSTPAVNQYIQDREIATQNVETDLKQLRTKLTDIINTASGNNQLQILLENLQYILKHPEPTTQEQLLWLHNKLNTIISKVMFNFLFVFNSRQVKILLFERVYKGYDADQKKQIKQELSQTRKIMEIVKYRTKLPIQDREKYQKLSLGTSEEDTKKYFVDRIFFQIELMKNSRLLVMSNIQKDYQTLRKIAEQAHAIVSEIYDPKCQDPLSVKIRQLSNQKGDVFIPNQYLRYQRSIQKKNFERILQKLQYPKEAQYQQLKALLKSTATMLVQKINYNNSSWTIFTRDPYKNQQMLNVIAKIQTIEEVKQFGSVVTGLIKNVKDNNNIAQILQTYDQIQGRLNKIIRNQAFGIELVDQLVQVQNSLITTRIKDIIDVNQIISDFKSCVQLVIAYQNYSKREVLNSYIKRSVQISIDKFHEEPEGFHIVMQSAPFSETYFHDIIQTIKEFKIEMRSFSIDPLSSKKYNIPITSITSSNVHSIASILYACDLSLRIKDKYLNEIKDLTYENQRGFIERIESRLKSGQWAKKLPILLRDVSTLYTKQAIEKNLFIQTQTRINKQYKEWDQFKGDMLAIQSNNEDYKERVGELIQESLNCIMDEVYKNDEKSLSIEDKLDRIADTLALKYKDKKYQEQGNVKPVMELIGLVSKKYVDLLKCLVENSTYISEELVLNISRNQKKDAWKGLILGQIHSSLQVKRLVQRILEDSGLAKNTTLEEFYQACRRKMTLNFSVISTRSNCIEFFNHYTRPYMPLWAAVVASSSLIQFFKPVVDKIEWNYQLVNNPDLRKIKMCFDEPGQSTHHLYSADSLRRLPVDLLKNDKMCKKIYNRNKFSANNTRKEAYLIFDFSHNHNYPQILKRTQRNRDNKNLIKVQNISIKDIVKITSVKGVSPSNLLNAPLVTGNARRLKLYMDSHDQLIVNLYKKELIMLPIRLGTLDFHLMCQKVGDTDKLSNLSNDSIMQSYFAMLEKIQIYRGLQSEEDRPKKYLYFRVESRNSSQKSKQVYAAAVRFLSKLVPNKAYQETYKIYYKENANDRYKKIDDEYIRLKAVGQLFLKIAYVDIRRNAEEGQSLKVKYRFFSIDLRNLNPFVFDNFQFGYVYCLEYTKSQRQVLIPSRGVNGDFYTDYILSEHIRNIPVGSLILDAVELNGLDAIKYETPVCDEYHPLQLKIVNDRQVSIYDNPLITLKMGLPVYKCNTCQQNHAPKSEYSIAEKYQIKLEKDNSIKCTFNHPVKLIRRLNLYPLGIQFIKCDRCGQNSPLGFFKDVECNVDVCFACVFNMIKDQL